MKPRQIISNAIDMCGAAAVEKLPDDQAALYFLNVMADYDLELSASSKGQRFYSFTQTLAAGADSGTFSDTTITLRPEFVRIACGGASASGAFQRTNWQIIDVVDDISDLTEAENSGRRAILFLSVKPLTYRLSWSPAEAVQAEIFGKKAGAAITLLDAVPSDFPEEFSHLIATEIALLLMSDLLLFDNADQYLNFVKTRVPRLEERKAKLKHRWDVYRSNADDAASLNTARPYEISADFGDSLDDGSFGYL